MQLRLDLGLLVLSLLFCILLLWGNSLQYQVEESFRDVMKRIFRFSNEICFAVVILKLEFSFWLMRSIFIIKDFPNTKTQCRTLEKDGIPSFSKPTFFISHSQSNKPMVHPNATLVFVPPPSFCPWCSYSSCNNQTLASLRERWASQI